MFSLLLIHSHIHSFIHFTTGSMAHVYTDCVSQDIHQTTVTYTYCLQNCNYFS